MKKAAWLSLPTHELVIQVVVSVSLELCGDSKKIGEEESWGGKY